MPATSVDDGYDEEEIIDATTRYPRTWIKFRPMLRGERQRLLSRGIGAAQQMREATTEKERQIADEAALAATREVAKSLDKHLIEWDRTHRKTGAPIPISVDTIANLPGPLFEKIYNAVAMFGEKPDQPDALSPEQESAKNSEAASA